ncbi:flagellar hook-associated protein FlgK [uncultured Tolumonas sp.]|uniref:flagellar hook-associated protein FlgK n=1 Tax=uncultured Tolumonas sp. TaxID=263765 RepID=UPI002A0A7CFA|nr:flagellar hook-associated protein FlgK [uncultured Tolumonas sp.]
MASDLLSIGSSGLLAQQKMLATTSSNISNVSTEGYSRQNTLVYSNENTLGVGNSYTRRLIDTYAQSEVWRDTATYNQVNTTYTELSQLDKYLSNSATSLSDSIDSFFTAMQAANTSPNTTSARQGLMGQISTITNRFQSVSTQLTQQNDDINGKISIDLSSVNSTLKSISDLNDKIVKTIGVSDDGTRENLLDQRDQLIKQLSEKMDIRTVSQSNGTTLVNLNTGESLVLSGSYAQLSSIPGNPDPKNTGVQVKLGSATFTLNNKTLGGTLGGYLAARDTITETQREVGQLALAFSDAMNYQNKLGMTLNNTIGGNLFNVAASAGLPSSTNTGTGSVTMSVIAGQGSKVPPNDFKVVNNGASYDVYMIDASSGAATNLASMTPAKTLADYGLQLNPATPPATLAVNDSFLLQPARGAAGSITTVITDSSDLALASPLKISAAASNNGSASLSIASFTDTLSFGGTPTSLLAGKPASIEMTAAGVYTVKDASGTILGTSSSATNILTNLSPALSPAAGFDLSLSGTAQVGDKFTLSFNQNGFSDNTNGLALAALQTTDLVRKGASDATDNKMTFNEAFTTTLTGVGTTVNGLNTSVTAANTKLTQSQEMYDSVAGVNLDEEAANLVRFQQAYAASAKVISAARDVFDTLLSAVK